MYSGSQSFHPNDFSKTVLGWTFETLSRPLDGAVRQAPLPRREQSLARYYANYLNYILEESRAIIAGGLDKVRQYDSAQSTRRGRNTAHLSDAKPFNLTLKNQARLPKNEGNPLSMTFRGRIPDKVEHGKSMIVLLLKTKNIDPEKKFIALATENQDSSELFVKIIISSEDYNAYEECFARDEQWQAHYLGSVISEQRMYDACLDATDIPCIQQIVRGEIQAPRTARPSREPIGINHLNLSQRQAIYAFLNAREGSTLLLQGPPGTGKTTTLVHLLKQVAGQNKRTLVSAHSNKAVQVLALRAVEEMLDVPMILVGVESKLPEKLQPIFLDRWYSTIRSFLSPYRDDIEQLAQTLTSDTRIPINTMLAEISSNMQAVQRALTTFDLIYVAQLSEEAKESLAALTKDPFLTSDFENAQRIINAVKTQPRSKECWNNLLTVINRLTGKWIRFREEGLKSYLLDNATIVFSTLIACGRKNMLSMAPIDFLLVDEAAQSVEAATLIPMRFQPSKVLLVGDTKQLPATVISSTLDDNDRSIRRTPSHYQWSMMWRLIEENHQPSLMLTIQYRMHPHICRWPSGQYYEDRLITSPDILPMPLLSHTGLLSRPYAIYQVAGQVESRDGSHSVSNKHEAQYVIKIIEHIRRQHAQCSIGIITPYVAQKQLINEGLASRRNLSALVDVNTVDGFQGDERDVIIISFTRTHVSAFLKEFRRLNVAITRPKACLIILGAPSLLSNDIGEMMEDARLRKALYSEHDLNTILSSGIVPAIVQQENPYEQFERAKRMAATDSAQALLWARRAAENNHPEAQHYISQIYLSSDVQLGISWLNKAAHQGIPLAQFALGQHFITGTVIVKDAASGILWCERAATTNLMDAIVFLAKCYEEGVEIASNPTQAQNYYRRAAKLAHTPSFIKLATLLARGTLDNQREAIKWYRKAAEKNIADAYYPLANLLSIVLNNSVEALTYQVKAAESGHREAQYAVALRFKHGDAQCAINSVRAAHFFKLAAIAGHRDAQFIYATCLKEGDGVERNEAQAVQFFQHAADNGHIESCYQYALLKSNQSPQEAYSYAMKAAQQQHVLAQYACIHYQLQSGRDLASCLAFCEQLVSQGDSQLLFVLARLLATGIAGKTDKAQAHRYYVQVANSHHALAQYYCAVALEEGDGVNRNVAEARRYYEICFERCIEARPRLARLLLQVQDSELHEIRAVELLTAYYARDRRENMLAPVTREQLVEHLITSRVLDITPFILDSIDTHSAYANYSLGMMLKEGKGVAKNTTKALAFLKKAADRDHIEACYQVSLLKEPISLEEAYFYYKKAALSNHALAQRECIRYQLKHNHDLESCLVFCEHLVTQGDDSLKFVLARLLDTGIARKTDKAAAYGYYSTLASSNHALACYYGAIMLEEGMVIPQDLIKARQYYASSPARYVEAKFRWACLLLEAAAKDLNERKPARVQPVEDLEEIELEGVSCMPRRKESTFFSRTNAHAPLTTDQAQAIGLLEFYYNHYDDEKPVLPDTLDHAIERLLFSKPAVTIRADNTYSAQANYWLGKIFEDGKGVTIDGQRALSHYQLASSVNAEASYRIGYIHESGLGVPKSWTLAKGFYQRAADRGHELAAKRLSWSYALWSGPTPNDVALRQANNCVLM